MIPKPPITFRIEEVGSLSPTLQTSLFNLLTTHFEGVTEAQFHRDLSEKQLVLILEQNRQVIGFSTLLSFSTQFQGEWIHVIYSGDTIVQPEAWGSTALPRAWVHGVQKLQAQFPPGRTFWLLLSSGFRTYRFMSVFWKTFVPQCNPSAPPELLALLHHLASTRFGSQFTPELGIVRFHHPQRLRQQLSEVPTGRELNPHTEFFLQKNPGHLQGDELVCLTEIHPENLTAAGRRMMPPHEWASHHR